MSECDGSFAESMTTDRAFDLLGDATRRRALAVLRESDGTVVLDELATAVVARSPDSTSARASGDRRTRIAASLHHSHLPKLDDASVVDYDPATNRIETSSVAEELDPLFEAVATELRELRSD